jgi:hypothetical protein
VKIANALMTPTATTAKPLIIDADLAQWAMRRDPARGGKNRLGDEAQNPIGKHRGMDRDDERLVDDTLNGP